MNTFKRQYRRKNRKEIEGSTRITVVTLVMTFFFFLLGNFIRSMKQVGFKVNIESKLTYPADFYINAILITSLLFMLYYALRYCFHELYTFINCIDNLENIKYKIRADSSFVDLLNTFKQQLVVIMISLVILMFLYGLNPKKDIFIIISMLVIIIILWVESKRNIRDKKRFIMDKISSVTSKIPMYILKILIFMTVLLTVISSQGEFVINKYVQGYYIEFINGEVPLIRIVTKTDISNDLEIYITNEEENKKEVDKNLYCIKSSHMVNEINTVPTESIGIFGVKNESYYDLTNGFERYHIIVPITDYIEPGRNKIELSFSNKRQSVAIINYIFWNGESGEFIENVIESK